MYMVVRTGTWRDDKKKPFYLDLQRTGSCEEQQREFTKPEFTKLQQGLEPFLPVPPLYSLLL